MVAIWLVFGHSAMISNNEKWPADIRGSNLILSFNLTNGLPLFLGPFVSLTYTFFANSSLFFPYIRISQN